MNKNKALTPKEIVQELDRYIVGQNQAKKAVAIALRNRWRRQKVDKKLKDEILPKNIIMMGPTGCGKTEIARRLAKLVNAPFVKVEATKFTEIGYVGRDVDSMVRDLLEVSVKMCREDAMAQVKTKAKEMAEERLLDLLLPKKESSSSKSMPFDIRELNHVDEKSEEQDETREKMRAMLKDGKFNDKEVNIEMSKAPTPMPVMHMFGHASSMEEMAGQIQEALSGALGGRGGKKKQKMLVPEALEVLQIEEAQRLIDNDQVQKDAVNLAEQSGIIFIDEIDKIAKSDGGRGPDVSREGVQRDILPIVEGSTVSTKYGFIKTDHILFIAAGAFHISKPSDLIPELQGRFPIRVELDSLKEEDFVRILTEPENSLVRQYCAMLATEKVNIDFNASGIASIAQVAFKVNSTQENIGARRLYTVMEKLLEEESFSASEIPNTTVVVDAKLVKERLSPILENEDLGKYIL